MVTFLCLRPLDILLSSRADYLDQVCSVRQMLEGRGGAVQW